MLRCVFRISLCSSFRAKATVLVSGFFKENSLPVAVMFTYDSFVYLYDVLATTLPCILLHIAPCFILSNRGHGMNFEHLSSIKNCQ